MLTQESNKRLCCLCFLEMIKIISYIVIAFCHRKANIQHRWSNILCIFYGNKGVERPVSLLQILLI